MRWISILAMSVIFMVASNTMAAELTVLSAGAVEPGLIKVIDAFRRDTAHAVKITFATAPAIRKRLSGGETVDVAIVPADVIDDLVKAGKVSSADRVTVGKIGVGIMVRNGAPIPKVATVDEFKQSLLSADELVYNQASTGIYLESLFDRHGISEPLKAKTTRYPDAAGVLDHVSKGKGNVIGFGATTVIIEGAGKGLQLVGPLPAEIQNYTTYAAAVVTASAAARALVRYLASPAAKALFTAAGIEHEIPPTTK